MRIDRILDLHEDLTAEAVHGSVLPNGWWLPTGVAACVRGSRKLRTRPLGTFVRARINPSSLSTVRPRREIQGLPDMFVAKSSRFAQVERPWLSQSRSRDSRLHPSLAGRRTASPGHPERPARVDAFLAGLGDAGRAAARRPPRRAADTRARARRRGYARRIFEAVATAPRLLDARHVRRGGISVEAALHAAGAAIAAVTEARRRAASAWRRCGRPATTPTPTGRWASACSRTARSPSATRRTCSTSAASR